MAALPPSACWEGCPLTLSEQLGAYAVALRVAEALERLNAPYFLGGSLASSLHGEPRATNDIDLVVDLHPGDVHSFSEALGADFDVDEEALGDALRRGGSWNIFYLPLVLKIDLFQKGSEPFDESEFSRRRLFELAPGRRLFVKSPEDSVLRKLLWFRQGGEVAAQQWRDLVEILRVGRSRLDQEYLMRWAATLGLSGLFEQAQAEAARPFRPR
jgi:hypothetical protein